MANDFIMSDERRNELKTILEDSDPSPRWVELRASASDFRRFELTDGLFKVTLLMGDTINPRHWSVHFHDLRISERLNCAFGCDPKIAQKEAGKIIKEDALKIMAFAIQL